jgi:hypothetical protein
LVTVFAAEPDVQNPIRLAEAALARWSEGEKSDVLNTLGAALYRAGRFEEAIRRLNKSSKTQGDEGVPKRFAFLAMAHHRLGHQDDAKHWLDKLIASQVNEVPGSWDDIEIRIRVSRGRIADPGKHHCGRPHCACDARQECKR